MADEKDKIAKLEERLAKATETFKTMKVQMEEKDKEIESLKTRVAELEDELTLNGGATEEVENLKGRLEKAKEMFTTQKAKIAEMTEKAAEYEKIATTYKTDFEASENRVAELSERVSTLEEDSAVLDGKLNKIAEIIAG